jgi:hypothetical protein
MTKPPPISLKIRAAKATARARQTLRRLEADDLAQRRIQFQVQKAAIAVRELTVLAGPRKERVLSGSDYKRWQTQCAWVLAFLKEMDRGV